MHADVWACLPNLLPSPVRLRSRKWCYGGDSLYSICFLRNNSTWRSNLLTSASNNTMTSLQPSFMLPPNFLFPPQGQIKPGVVLRDGKHGVPDPSLPLHYGPDSAEELDVTSLQEFHYHNESGTNTGLGLWMDSASIAGFGISGEHGKHHGLTVDTGSTQITRLAIKDMEAYVRQLMTDPVLKEYTKMPRCRPVYLITGVMVVEDATIEVATGHSAGYKARIALSGDGFAVPVQVGAEIGRQTGEARGPTWKLAKPFVLAYEVSRIQRKLGGTRAQSYNRHALWDDSATATIGDEWAIAPLTKRQGQSEEI